jgi:Glycosyl hydrolase catalytic core
MRTSLAAAVAASFLLVLGATGCGKDPEPEAPPTPPGFFGVVPQGLLTAEELERMDQGNVGTLRIVMPWGLLDPTPEPDDGDFTTIDPVVLLAADHGIRLIPTIYGTPDWVARDLDDASCEPSACAAFAPRSPRALEAWSRFVTSLVDRYGEDGTLWAQHPDVTRAPLRVWQIWNEQNSPTFYEPAVDPAGYQRLLSAASEAIRSRDHGAEVILGGMFGTPPPGERAWKYLRELYSIDGTADEFDAVAAHPYAANEKNIELQVERLHDEIERAGDDAKMWITEVGASSDTGNNPLELGLDGQAEQLTEAFTYFLEQREAFDIEGVTWYSWRDTSDPNQCDWCPGSGLFEEKELTAKPAWEAFVSFTGGS